MAGPPKRAQSASKKFQRIDQSNDVSNQNERNIRRSSGEVIIYTNWAFARTQWRGKLNPIPAKARQIWNGILTVFRRKWISVCWLANDVATNDQQQHSNNSQISHYFDLWLCAIGATDCTRQLETLEETMRLIIVCDKLHENKFPNDEEVYGGDGSVAAAFEYARDGARNVCR